MNYGPCSISCIRESWGHYLCLCKNFLFPSPREDIPTLHPFRFDYNTVLVLGVGGVRRGRERVQWGKVKRTVGEREVDLGGVGWNVE